MPDTFSVLADIISQVAEIDRAQVRPESNAIDELGIDSVDFLDVVYEIENHFDIKIPIDEWERAINDGRSSVEEVFLLKNLADRIDALIAQKNA